MKAALTIENAQLKTVSVEINALTVSGRQVTQSVFKQMVVSQLIKHSGDMAGTPWGWVNYGLEGHAPGSRNVVWVEGRELRRCIISPIKWDKFVYRNDDAVFDLIASGFFFPKAKQKIYKACLEGQSIIIDNEHPGLNGGLLISKHLVALHALRDKHTVYLVDGPSSYFVARETGGDAAYLELRLFSAWDNGFVRVIASREKWEKVVDWTAPADPEANERFGKIIDDAFEAEIERRKRHENRWREILDLPQLFIAV